MPLKEQLTTQSNATTLCILTFLAKSPSGEPTTFTNSSVSKSVEKLRQPKKHAGNTRVRTGKPISTDISKHHNVKIAYP